ncbi:Bax inhibitor-1/YccA family protein [Parachlamydia sp. AcF125]|uniref:Bax inhibitor-1/YccA family protein n=1 Tax=Parachlamydia sp. AcF125 TaxID=2795736 RepID=UPI001BC91ABA|nr:Bax inhibitor-1/YccA family protein [Parachlamydia sp. AcF125]MBS4168042.1 hypothetical protein [Parachlamydia sp. AcF125]
MRSSNPALLGNTFQSERYYSLEEKMTVSGVVNKTAILLSCVLLTAGWTWIKFYQTGNVQVIYPWMMAGVVGGLILAVVTAFKKEWAPVTSIGYALLEGLFIGGISSVFEKQFPGVVIQATALTFGTLFSMLVAYRSGFIQATDNFRLGVAAATGGIAIVYFATMLLSLFGVSVPYIYGGGIVGILFSLFVVAIAALNFIIDFDFIEQGAQQGAPKYMEWYGGFALMVTLIWLYVEFLRLLSKLRER